MNLRRHKKADSIPLYQMRATWLMHFNVYKLNQARLAKKRQVRCGLSIGRSPARAWILTGQVQAERQQRREAKEAKDKAEELEVPIA